MAGLTWLALASDPPIMRCTLSVGSMPVSKV